MIDIHIYDTFPAIVFDLDYDGRVVYINNRGLELLSCGLEDIIGMKALDLIVEDDRERAVRGIRGIIDDGKSYAGSDYTLRRKDGMQIPVKLYLNPVAQGEGNPATVRGIAVDLSEQKNLMDELVRREELYRLIAENSTDIVWVLDLKTLRFTYTSPRVYPVRGLTVDEALKEQMENVFPPEEVTRVLNLVGKEVEEDFAGLHPANRVIRFEAHQYKKDGSIIWVDIHCSFLRDAEGRAYAVQGSTRDITEKKAAEIELQNYKDSLEDLVNERTRELNEMNSRLELEIIERRRTEEELRLRNEAINRELDEARNVHQALLPLPFESDFIAVDYRYLPIIKIGGDYVSFTELRNEKAYGIFIGDVSGHGVSAALYSFLVKAVADRVCRLNGLAPQKYMSVMNDELLNVMTGNYLTGIYGVLKERKGRRTFTYARAGHPYPIYYSTVEGAARQLKSGGTALGLFGGRRFEEITLNLSPGDRVFLYTDGIPEIINSRSKMLEYEGLLKIINEANRHGYTLSDTIDSIIDRVEHYRGSAPREDDIVLVGIEAR